MSNDLTETELIKILADLKGDSSTRLDTVKRLGRNGLNNLLFVLDVIILSIVIIWLITWVITQL